MKKITLFAMALFLGASAQAKTSGALAKSLWDTLDMIAKLENLQMHKINGDQDTLQIDDVACVSESYDACSFFAHIDSDRKLVVHQDLAPKLMRVLINSDIPYDDNGALYVRNIECIKASEQYTCYLDQ